jgi:signal transduction histidine kinase
MWEMVTNGLESLTESTNFEYVEHPQNLKIRIDRIDLESILTNLLTNSLESMKNTKTKNNTVRCDATYLKSGLVIKFSDNGKGILMKDKEYIFEPFVTTNKTADDVAYGHGLGLTIVREILKKYDGTVEVTSPGYFRPGTTFVIKIPTERVRMVG